MKKGFLFISLISTFAMADSYVVLVDSESNDYETQEAFKLITEYSEWTDSGIKINCSSLPSLTDYYKGVSFNQTTDCDQNQERTKSTYKEFYSTGERVLESEETESQTIQTSEVTAELGTYLALNCKDVVDHSGKNGNGLYETTIGQVYCDMDYKDGTGYNRTQLYKPDQSLLGGCTHWRDKRAEFCSSYTDTLAFTLNKVNYAYVEFKTYNYSGSPANGNTSVISVSDVNVTYNLLSEVQQKADISHNANGDKSMIIRFSHDATGSGKDNNMGVRDIYLYEQ